MAENGRKVYFGEKGKRLVSVCDEYGEVNEVVVNPNEVVEVRRRRRGEFPVYGDRYSANFSKAFPITKYGEFFVQNPKLYVFLGIMAEYVIPDAGIVGRRLAGVGIVPFTWADLAKICHRSKQWAYKYRDQLLAYNLVREVKIFAENKKFIAINPTIFGRGYSYPKTIVESFSGGDINKNGRVQFREKVNRLPQINGDFIKRK